MQDYIKNSTFLKSLYPTGLDLESVVVVSMLFTYNGPSVEIRIQSASLPTVIPKKWSEEFNRVSVAFELFDLKKLRFDKWGRENVADIVVDVIDENDLRISILGKECSAEFQTTGMYFKSISPFLSEE